jgi:transportin-3
MQDILVCLESWIRLGTIPLEMIQSSPIIDLCFESLNDHELFDTVVDILIEIILKSSITRDETLLHNLTLKIFALEPMLQANLDDVDVVRGLCRIFVEAAECYMDLIVANLPYFQSILKSVLVCATYDDLDICKITFNVW